VPDATRGLFATDYFKPPPKPPAPPPKPPPARRDVPLVYRGLAEFGGSSRVAYLVVETRTLTLAAGEEVLDGWRLEAFDAERAVLRKGEETRPLTFNQRAALSVPAKP
jgi:hypothetical protein